MRILVPNKAICKGFKLLYLMKGKRKYNSCSPVQWFLLLHLFYSGESWRSGSKPGDQDPSQSSSMINLTDRETINRIGKQKSFPYLFIKTSSKLLICFIVLISGFYQEISFFKFLKIAQIITFWLLLSQPTHTCNHWWWVLSGYCVERSQVKAVRNLIYNILLNTCRCQVLSCDTFLA